MKGAIHVIKRVELQIRIDVMYIWAYLLMKGAIIKRVELQIRIDVMYIWAYLLMKGAMIKRVELQIRINVHVYLGLPINEMCYN